MADIIIHTEEEAPEEEHVEHHEGVCCEHCVQLSERVAVLEQELAGIHTSLLQIDTKAAEATLQAEEAQQTAEAAAVVAMEVVIEQEQEESIDESELSGPGESEVGGPPGVPDEQPGYNAAESEPITIQVEPEKEPEKQQPSYGFRRGKHR